MGISGFRKWLGDKYPNILVKCIEEKPYTDDNGVYHPVDETRPNPNRIRFHNLYIDMNSIVHTYAESLTDQDEIIQSVLSYIDRIFSIVRPSQIIYMALDGVPPRAKMNDQRSNRFCKTKRLSDGMKGKFIALEQRLRTTFDKCHIKPGTPFMSKLSNHLRTFIYERMNTKQTWRLLKVILSDVNVPGEGEHKIMESIRRQRVEIGYDPTTHHIVYSNDSDLILLGLATHKLHFTILSEYNTEPNEESKFLSTDLSKLRQYLSDELKMRNLFRFQWNLERVIDDWVFLCLLLGNDFLPTSPSIGKPRQIMDRLINLYKNTVYKIREYLTENGVVYIENVKVLFRNIGREENDKFKNEHRRNNDDDDPIRLWEEDWHERYYQDKFNVSRSGLNAFCNRIAQEYARGLCWILHYYYQGVPSWNWFYYPFYYAPFASDFSNLTTEPIVFARNTTPFNPLEQMMAIFAPQNARHLPIDWQPLLLDKNSPIIDFYPEIFTIDPNGEYYASNYIALLPFIDEQQLHQALKVVYPMLTSDEEERHRRNDDRLFIHLTNSWYQQLRISHGQITQTNPLRIKRFSKGEITGQIWSDNDTENIDMNGSENQVTCFKYRNL